LDTGRRVDGGRAEQEGVLRSFLGQRMGVEFSIAGEEFVGFDLAQVVAELVESVVVCADVQDGQDGLVEVRAHHSETSVSLCRSTSISRTMRVRTGVGRAKR